MAPTAIKPAAVRRARGLRQDMTEGEKSLWSELRKFRKLYSLHVRKQVPIGPYVADFAIHSKKIIIEVDGEHHFLPDRMMQDKKRDGWLVGQGFRILRFNTGELLENFEGCVEKILREAGVF